MNAVFGMDKPPEGTVSSCRTSRRIFLKCAGLAGAAGLTSPFLARTSAGAATRPPIILGVNAPNPWSRPRGRTWPDLIHGAVGCRRYLDNVLHSASDVEHYLKNGGFPVEHVPTRMVASIRPDPRVLLDHPDKPATKALIGALNKFILDGMTKAGKGHLIEPQLNAWHEAGNLYTGRAWEKYGLVPGHHVKIRGHSRAAQEIVRDVHIKMKELCDNQAKAYRSLPRVEYGCIIYGNISKMADWIPYAPHALDWYGIDVYYEGDGKGTDCTHPDLSKPHLVSNYLDPFRAHVQRQSRLTWPKINICECNAKEANYAARPDFFKNLAEWLYSNGGYRMLTFFHTEAAGQKPAPHSVPWAPPDKSTIDALKYIQATYG